MDGEILWLGEPGADDVRQTGGKAANLSRLGERFPVPSGFVVPAAIFESVLERGPAARSA